MKRALAIAMALILVSAFALVSNIKPTLASSLLLEMEVNMTLIPVGEEVDITLTLTNVGDTDFRITYGPPLFDAGYCKPEGCFYWSDGKAFVLVILDLVLEPGESVTQTLEWNLYQYMDGKHYPPDPGTYSLFGFCLWAGVSNSIIVRLNWNFADVNYDLRVNIYDVVMSTSAYGSSPFDPHWDADCDIVEPFGKVDIYDIVMLIDSYGEEYSL